MSLLTLLHTRGGVFVPSDVSDLALWLDASVSSSITLSGSDVTNWSDLSGSAHHAARAGASQGPNLISAGTNGRDVIDYTHTSGDDMLITTGGSINNLWDGGGYAALVMRIDSDGGSDTGRVFDKSGTNTGWFLDFREESAENVKFNFKQEFSTQRYVGRSTAADITTGAWHIIDFSYSSDSTSNVVSVKVDGASKTISTAVTPSGTRVTDAAENLGIGGQSTGGTGLSIDGRVAEVLFYSSIPTSTQQSSIRDYLASKWGVTVS